MKFNGKKTIMAAALSAIVAASSFGTAITASAADTYRMQYGRSFGNGGAASGTLTGSKHSGISAGEQITITATPDPGCYVCEIFIENQNTQQIIYETSNCYDTTWTYPLIMPSGNVYVHVSFRKLPMPTPDPTPDPTPTWKKGDVNLDGYVNGQDATLVLKHAVKLKILTGQRLLNGDMNGDGHVTAADATEILKTVVGIA